MRGGERISKESEEGIRAFGITFGESGVDDYMGKAHLLIEIYQFLLGMKGLVGD